MPKLLKAVPKHRKHKASRQAAVAVGGTDRYLGPHGSKSSRVCTAVRSQALYRVFGARVRPAGS